jgi:hypothetical protein
MQTWEYKCLNANELHGPALDDNLNDLSKEGWEVVCTALQGGNDHGYVVLKRLATAPAPSRS